MIIATLMICLPSYDLKKYNSINDITKMNNIDIWKRLRYIKMFVTLELVTKHKQIR